MKIPYLSLTLGQQGGIGYPPRIVKLDKWYAVSDSRIRNPSNELDSILDYQIVYPKKSKHWHSQLWVYHKWSNAPQITWRQVEQYAGLSNRSQKEK